jgi:hypothetical protein
MVGDQGVDGAAGADGGPDSSGGSSGGLLRGRRTHHPGRRLSQILADIAAEEGRERVSVADILAAMHGRAFGALMLIFAFPNILPSPPGLAGVLGLPLIFLSAQMMLGRMPWLPAFIGQRSVTRDAFAGLVDRAAPWLTRAERLLTQRLSRLASGAAERALGAVCLMLSLLLVLPVPFGNMLPSIAISLIGLGVLERDGVWVAAGIGGAAIAMAVVGGLAYAVVMSTVFLLGNAF